MISCHLEIECCAWKGKNQKSEMVFGKYIRVKSLKSQNGMSKNIRGIVPKFTNLPISEQRPVNL